jgi:hypothetical protein
VQKRDDRHRLKAMPREQALPQPGFFVDAMPDLRLSKQRKKLVWADLESVGGGERYYTAVRLAVVAVVDLAVPFAVA